MIHRVAVGAWLVLVLALALVAATRVPHVVESSSALLSVELARGIPIYRDPAQGGSALQHAPLFYFLVSLVARVADHADPVVLGRALAGASILLSWGALLAWARARDARVAPALLAHAAALLVFNAFAVNARADGLASALALASLLALDRGLASGRRSLGVLSLVLAVLAAATKQTLVWLGPLEVYVLLREKRAWVAPGLAASVVATLACGALAFGVGGSWAWFYCVRVPAVHERSLDFLLDNLVPALPALAGLGAWGWLFCKRADLRLRDPLVLVPLGALGTGLVFSSKIGARADAYVPFAFLVAPLIARATKRIEEEAPLLLRIFVVYWAVLGLVAGFDVSRGALESRRAREEWLARVRAEVARVTSDRPGVRVRLSEALLDWNERGVLRLECYEASLDADLVHRGALEACVRGMVGSGEDVVVVSVTPECDRHYGVLERGLEDAGYVVRASFAAGQRTRSGIGGWSVPATRVYVRGRR